jgi:hypothetical protein
VIGKEKEKEREKVKEKEREQDEQQQQIEHNGDMKKVHYFQTLLQMAYIYNQSLQYQKYSKLMM